MTKKGEWVFIDEVGRGQPSLYCPFCKSLLIAKKGLARIHHFIHEEDDCAQLLDALKACQIPTIDNFELLDEQESRYLEFRKKHQHSDIPTWPEAHEAVLRLSAMGILVVDSDVDPVIAKASTQLKKFDPELFTEQGLPSEKLHKLFTVLEPFADLKERWKSAEKITSTKISSAYASSLLVKQISLAQLENAQRYWFDAFCKRQHFLHPEYHLLLNKILLSLNYQSLYVMEITGDFPNCPERFIKIGSTSRHINFRLTEVKTDLSKLGTLSEVNVFAIVKGVGRLEKLIYQRYEKHRIQIGSHLSFYSDDVKLTVLNELKSIANVEAYSPPLFHSVRVVPRPGRQKKSVSQLLSDYPEVVSALNSHQMSVRKACRETGRASATVQKVKKAMLQQF